MWGPLLENFPYLAALERLMYPGEEEDYSGNRTATHQPLACWIEKMLEQ